MNPRVIAVWILLLSVTIGMASLRPVTSRDVLFVVGFATVAAGWGFVVDEQMSHAPIFAEQLIDPIWQQTETATAQNLAGSVSVARYQPYFAAGSQIACMLAIAAGFLVGRDRNAAYLLLKTFAGSGLFYAVYGILAFVFAPGYVLWQEKFSYGNSLVVTFVNPNVAAVYLGPCAIAWLLFLAKTVRIASAGQSAHWRNVARALFNRPSQWTVISFTASFIVISAMFMTGSRAGSVLSLVAISGAAATFYRRQLGTRGLVLVFPVFAASAIIVMIQIFGSRVNQRFNSEGLFDSGRWNVYLSTLKIIEDHPWLGTGLGTFRWAFPKYRTDDISISGIWEQAHSTTLEIASEMGIPFTVLVIAGWLMVFIVLCRGMLARKRDEVLPLAAFWIGLLAVIHSQIDFSLQIPGFSIAICTLIGMGLAQSASSRGLNPTR
jgi:O-antigen ligase